MTEAKATGEIEAWSGSVRADGMQVMQTPQGNWIIVAPDTRPPIAWCACCGKLFATQYAAKCVADAVYPVKEA